MQRRSPTVITAVLISVGFMLTGLSSAYAGTAATPAPLPAATTTTKTIMIDAATMAADQTKINAAAKTAGITPRQATSKIVVTTVSTPIASPAAAPMVTSPWHCRDLSLTYNLYDPFQYGSYVVRNSYCWHTMGGAGVTPNNAIYWYSPAEAYGNLTAWGVNEGWQQGGQWYVGTDSHGWYIQDHAIERLSWCPPRAICVQTEDVHVIANGNYDGTTSSEAYIQ